MIPGIEPAGGSDPDLGLGSLGSLGISGVFGGPGIGDLGLLGDVPPMRGPVFGLPGDWPDTGLDAGDLLPVLDDDAGEGSATKYCDARSCSWLSSSNLLEPVDPDELPDDALAPPPPLLLCRKPDKL